MDIIDAIDHGVNILVEEAEELFPPKPGGLVDRHRKRMAEEKAAEEAGETSTTEVVTRNHVKGVRVIEMAADITNAQVIVLSAKQPVWRLLPHDDHRRNAVIISVDNDVYVTHDQGMAWNVQGAATNTGAFYLPKGIAITVASTSELWAAATTTATTSRISVLVNREA